MDYLNIGPGASCRASLAPLPPFVMFLSILVTASSWDFDTDDVCMLE
jgi:hypothetical protein